MAAATYFDAVQKIYVAFYGRPAEPSGLLYWANRLDSNGGNISAIINAFGESTESSNLYSGSTNAAVVSAIYQQILGRAPDADGSAFYVSKLQSNEYKASEVAYRIIDGVKGADVATVANKLSVAKAFTDAVTLDSAATLAYSGTAAETVGRDLLFGVTTSTTTANVADAIADLKDGGSVVDDVIVLTSADDEQDFSDSSSGVTVRINGDDDAVDGDDFEITGSSFNDTFILESFKDLVINAADGVDTLDLSEMEPGAGNGDVSLTSGLADAALSPGGGAISLLGFENVIASNDGGRIVGTSGANTITLGEGTDDIVAGAGDDTIVGDEDTFTTGTDTISGGLGQDTFELSGGDTQIFDQDDFTGIEAIIYTADGDDVTITAGDLFDDDAAPTTGITGGVTNIVVENGGDNTLNLTLDAGDEINLLGVTFTGVQTLGADAGGGGNINIDTDSLAGIETLNGGAADVLVMVEAGEYDLSSLTINDATNIESGAGDLDQTLVISRLGDIVEIDMGGGEDVIRGGGVLALDLRNLTTLASDTGALDLDFGSASAVTINVGATGSDVFTTITGSEDDDVLALYSTVDDSVAELGVVTGVETISLEYDDGISGTVLLINADSLSDGMTVVGDDGNEVIRANEDGVDVSQVELVGIESFDVNGVEVTASSAALAGLEIDNDVAGGELTITDTAVSLDFGDIGGALEVIFSASTGVNASIGDMVDTAAVTLTFGAGNDSLDLTDATISGNADSAVNLGRGNDSLRFGDTIANGGAQGGVDGSFGTDRLLVEGSVAAGDIDSAIFTNFEVLALATSESGDITIELGAGDVDVGTIDLSADTDTDGSNTVTLTAYDGGAITVVGSRDADDVTTGASSATVQAGLGNDTITVTGAALATALEAQSFSLSGGGGDDVFELLEDWATAGVGQHAILITDYSGDTIDIDATAVGTAGGNGTVELAQSVAQSIVNDAEPTSLGGALSALSREAFARDANLVTVFQFEGNTYLYVDGDAVDADFDSEQDFYITLTGLVTVDMADVTSFV